MVGKGSQVILLPYRVTGPLFAYSPHQMITRTVTLIAQIEELAQQEVS